MTDTENYRKHFSDGKLNVVFFPADTAGCGWYRCVIPSRSLNRLGIANTVVLSPNDKVVPPCDVLVIQRNVMLGRLKDALKIREQYGTLIVVEEDDNFRALPSNNPAFGEFHPHSNKSYGLRVFNERFKPEYEEKNLEANFGPRALFVKWLMGFVDDCVDEKEVWKKIPRNDFHEIHLHTVSQGDMVTVTTKHLWEVYSKVNPNCFVLPNCVDLNEEIYDTRQVPHDGIILGWAGSLTHLDDVRIINSAVTQLMHEHPELRLMLGCDFRVWGEIFNNLPNVDKFIEKVEGYYKDRGVMAKSVDDLTSEDNEVVSDCGRYIYRRGLSPAIYPSMYKDVDIGMVPLVLRSFNESKSDLKGLEMAAMQMPIVCSPTGEYSDWRHGADTGALIPKLNRHKFWYRYLKSLIVDEGYRKDMGLRARQFAKTRHIDNWATSWATAYMEGMKIRQEERAA